MGRASIFAFLLLLAYYWGLYCEILQLNFFLKHYSNGSLNGCVFEPDFKRYTKCTFMKIFWSFLDEKIPPPLMTGKIVSVQWRGHKFRFEWLITCPQTRKKGVKRLVRGRNTSILGQILWKQTERISLIFKRPETAKLHISTSQ